MRFHSLYQQLHQQSQGNTSDLSWLSEEIDKHPYFGPNYFFLLQRTPADSVSYATIAARTSLFFSNPYILNLQLNSKEISILPEMEQQQDNITPISSPVIVNDSPDNNNDLLFEPLHTTDYFASQGIKLSEEALNSDKLGKQLKSFTEWLKTIKKVHGNKLPELNASGNRTIEELAEKSNLETEVITEAMAEVYIQQGKMAKANEIYKKLSLQNPSKSSYFADKIK